MAEVKYLAHIDLNQNQLQNAAMQILSGDPSGFEGHVYYNSTSNVLKFHNGSGYVSLSSASGDIEGVTAGDGLTGGGSSGTVTLNVVGGDGITANANDVAITAAQTTITSVLNTALVVGRDADNQIKFGTDNTMVFRVGAGDGVTFKASGEIEATKFDGALEGNADTATALETARNIGGVSFDGTSNINLPGVNTAGNQNTSGTAAVATTVTITDNESTDEDNAIIFAAGGDTDGGNLGLESDGTLTYNPSTGKVTATGFVGALTGNASGSAGSVANALTVDDTTVQLNSGTTFNGSAARTLSAKTAAISNGGSGLATADQIHTFVTTQTDEIAADTSGAAATVTSIGNLTGDVTSSNRATTIAAAAVHHSMLHDDIISGQGALTSGLASTDELMISDAGTVKRMDVSVLQSFLQSNLTFTTNTDTDVSVANLKTRLAGGFGSNAVTIGDSDDTVTIGNDLVVTGDLTVSGDTISANVATLNVEDKNITLNYSGSDSSSTANGAGITIQDAVNSDTDATILWDATNDEFDFSHAINVTGTIEASGNITGNLVGNVTGNASGSAGTVTSIGNLTGDVTSSNRATTISAGAVHHSMLAEDIISGQSAMTAVAQADLLMIDDGPGEVKKITFSNFEDQIFGNISSDITIAAGGAATIAADAVTYSKIQNVSATNVVLGRDSAGAGVIEEISASSLRTMINVENGATADQTKSDIDGLAITTVGTLDTGDATAIVSAASTSAAGKVELATTAEALAGSDSSRAVTPAGLAARSFTATIGDGSDDDITVNHNLGTRNVIVQLYDASDYKTIIAEVVRTDANNVTINTNDDPSTIGSSDVIVLIQKID